MIGAPVDNFYPRSPCGERHGKLPKPLTDCVFLSTLSLRRATGLGGLKQGRIDISIHALLAESDRAPPTVDPLARNFYPRSPCGERPLITLGGSGVGNFYPRSPCGERRCARFLCWGLNEFLSTLSLRRATLTSVVSSTGTMDFYPRSPCGERPICKGQIIPIIEFLSTLSLRRATLWVLQS